MDSWESDFKIEKEDRARYIWKKIIGMLSKITISAAALAVVIGAQEDSQDD